MWIHRENCMDAGADLPQ